MSANARTPAAASSITTSTTDDLVRAVIDATTASVLPRRTGCSSISTPGAASTGGSARFALQEERSAEAPDRIARGSLAERDAARARTWPTAQAVGGPRGLERMQERGRLSATADPASPGIATMALLQGGLLLTQVRRDPKQLRTALAAARVLLRSAAA
jgi:hypothetical protein